MAKVTAQKLEDIFKPNTCTPTAQILIESTIKNAVYENFCLFNKRIRPKKHNGRIKIDKLLTKPRTKPFLEM